jgi:hypothetical protein
LNTIEEHKRRDYFLKVYIVTNKIENVEFSDKTESMSVSRNIFKNYVKESTTKKFLKPYYNFKL